MTAFVTFKTVAEDFGTFEAHVSFGDLPVTGKAVFQRAVQEARKKAKRLPKENWIGKEFEVEI